MLPALLLALLSLLPALALPPETPGGAGGAVSVTLEGLRQRPSHWLGRRVRFTLQHRAPAPERRRYLSRFDAARYLAFEAWGDEQPLWEREAFEAPHTHLFARRGGKVANLLLHAPPYARFEAVGTVHELFQGRPWIELEQVVPLEAALSEGALVHASRAGALIETGRWYLAADQLGRAMAGDLPDAARRELERLQATCTARHEREEEIRRLRRRR